MLRVSLLHKKASFFTVTFEELIREARVFETISRKHHCNCCFFPKHSFSIILYFWQRTFWLIRMNLKWDTQTFIRANKQTILSIWLSCMEQMFGNVAHWGPKETGTKKVIGYHVWRKKRLRRMNSNRIQACRSRGSRGCHGSLRFWQISTREADMPTKKTANQDACYVS